MRKRPPADRKRETDEEGLDIPELEDVVEAPAAPEPAPPPNLDLFGTDADFDRLREELMDRLTGEIETVIAQVRADIEQTLRARLEAQLRDRLGEVLGEVLQDANNHHGDNHHGNNRAK